MWIISPVISEMPIFPLSKDSVIQVLIRWVLTEVAGVCGGVDLPKEYQTFSVGSQQPQVRHFYGLAQSEPVCLRAALQSTMGPLSVSSRLKCCLYHLPVKTNTADEGAQHCHGQSLLTPSSFFSAWVCTEIVAAAPTRPQKPKLLVFASETQPAALLLTCSLSWELQQRPQTTVVAIKVVF